MLIKFESPCMSSFITTIDVAEKLIRAMGKSDPLEGIIIPAEISQIIQKLRANIILEKKEFCSVIDLEIGLSQRAFPLMEMLKKAEVKEEFIIWKVL